MKQKKSFKDYLESKELLRLALEEVPKVKEIYEVQKYCSIPIQDESETSYVKMKPKDLIEILWENIPDDRTPKYFTFLSDEEQKVFSWSNAKVRSWVDKNTYKVG